MENYTVKYGDVCKKNNHIDTDLYEKYGVKRGLRDKNGEGILIMENSIRTGLIF